MSRKKKVSFEPYDEDNEKHHKQGLQMCIDFWKERKQQLPFIDGVNMLEMYEKMERLAHMFVLEDRNGDVVAMGGTMEMPVSIGSMSLGSIAVRPEERGKGFGSQIVKDIEQVISSQLRYFGTPACTIYLSCFDDSLPFWEKMGYHVLETRTVDTLMSKTLW